MKSVYSKLLTLLACAFVFFLDAHSQQKLVVIGSSTSYGSGTTAYDSTYVARLQKYYDNNGIAVTIKNLAGPGTDCYSGMPSNYIPPPDRAYPDPARNITAALAENPDVVLVNYPTNGYYYFSISEVMNCLRIMKQTANNAGKRCYVTTTQPRTEYTAAARVRLRVLRDSILNAFGEFAINFYDGLAEPVSDTIAGPYRAGDGIHLNNAGHAVLAQRVEQKNIFSSNTTPNPPPGPLKFRYFTFTGTWNTLPDLNALSPVASGTMPNISLAYRSQNDRFAYQWDGYINIPVTGTYTFRTTSDDGSKLYIGGSGEPLVNNDGLHGPQEREGTINLNAGVYPISVLYFDQIWGEVMNVSWRTPQTGGSFVQIPNSAFVNAPTTPPPGGPLKYRYYTFSGTWYNLPDLRALTPVATGSVANITLENRTQNDHFAFLWEGYINIPVNGTYTFRIRSDDGSQLWIGGSAAPLINNDGLHGVQDKDGAITLNAGVYPIAISYYDQEWAETMSLLWNTPQTNGSFQTVPNSAFVISPATPLPLGLNYRYYTFSGTWYSMPNLQALIPVATGTVANISLDNRTQNDQFAYIWDGYINIPVSGEYTFRTTSDDGSQLWLGSLPGPLINNDGLHGPQSIDATIGLPAGTYPIAILYYDQIYGEFINVSWRTPQTGGNFVTIPNGAFSLTAGPALAALNETIVEYNIKATQVVLPGQAQPFKLAIFPNPAVEHVDLRLTDAENGPVQVKLISANGIVLNSRSYQKQNRTWQERIPVRHLKPGYYIIQVTGKKLNYRTSFIKK